MANFPKLRLTRAGIALQAKVEAGAVLSFTHIGMGDGSLGGRDPAELTALLRQRAGVAISGKTLVGTDSCQVKGFFSNQDITEGFWWREIGVLAQDPDQGEVLYCYANAGEEGEFIPTSEDQRIERQIYCTLSIQNADQVVIQIPETDTFIPTSEKGAPGGVTPLDDRGKVPEEFLPEIGGFVEMVTPLPAEERSENRLYGLILADHTGGEA